jgi:hypothetical protein
VSDRSVTPAMARPDKARLPPSREATLEWPRSGPLGFPPTRTPTPVPIRILGDGGAGPGRRVRTRLISPQSPALEPARPRVRWGALPINLKRRPRSNPLPSTKAGRHLSRRPPRSLGSLNRPDVRQDVIGLTGLRLHAAAGSAPCAHLPDGWCWLAMSATPGGVGF